MRALLTFLLALLFFLPACASGPQLPVTTTPQAASVTFQAIDGGTITLADCSITLDTQGNVKPFTLGNEVQASVDAAVDVPIGGIPSTPSTGH